MGSLAVLAMVDQVNPTASHSEGHHLHPLFQARRRASQTPPTKDRAESAQTSICSFDGAQDEETHGKRDGPQRKRQKLEPRVLEDEERQQLKKCNKASLGGTIMDHFTRLDRGHASSPSTNDENKQQDDEDEEGKGLDRPERLEPETTHGNRVTPAPYQTLASTLNPDPPMPKKVIRLNLKTGTLGSPPKPKPTPARVEHETEATKKVSLNGRGKKTRSRIVRIRYDTDAESRMRIGAKVNAILHGPHALSTGSPNTTNSQPSDMSAEDKKPVDQELPKTTHPFFLGQSKPPKSTSGPVDVKPEPTDPSSAKISSSTPCSPNKVRPISHNTRLPQFGVKSIGLKVPGSKLPAWPWKDMVHIRGDDSLVSCQSDEPTVTFASRKSKGRAVEISTRESVMEYITKRIDIPALTDAVRNANTDDFLPPPPEIRLPQKHFESGSKLQHRILPQLRCSKQKKAAGKKDAAGKANMLEHPPQLIRLFNSIQSELPAVDRSECETLSWTQKYAPGCAAEILQPGREAFFLKQWLQALMVQSVDTGSGDGEKSKGSLSKSKPSGPAKKRRKKKLDDFIVSSDEEADQMDEVSETETDWVASGTYGIVKKTVIRAGDLRAKGSKDSSRLTNTVVISGPHGCGKTAAVYAVAKELGFEVFEINSTSRRSGKDVLERIGDMTRNHLVSHQQRSNPEAGEETEEDPVDEGAAEDIKSGKQSTMISFFKPKATVDSSKKTTNPPSGGPPRKEAKKELPKGQKQSLILLEEADILFEEDKQFWTSVIGLIAQSKRPFIVTCNDETLLPLQTLNLHGIFRLSHPPTDLAVDRLILIAANEGHSLRRDAVEALFESRNRDLRAATMDLNYWCQIGVGDRRGGFEWFYLRWPKGIDLDENDEVVRVVSEDTYQPGMNWLVRDHVMDNLVHPGMAEEELLQQVWNSWNVDVGYWQSSTGLAPWAENLSTVTSEASGRLAALEVFDQFAEVMSASDICSCKAFARFQEAPIDATPPAVSGKAHDDYILGLPLLDTPSVVHYDSLLTVLPCTMRSMARAALQSGTSVVTQQPAPELDPLTEDQLLNTIRQHFITPSTTIGSPTISRMDIAVAFDPIAASDSPPSSAALSYLDPSIFDRTMKLITLDVAPYVRGIVAYDTHLQKQRLKLSNLVSEGGRSGKRMRTTRAAYSALEGGSRSTTRGERWFKADLNPHLVLRTGGDGWDKLAADNTTAQLEESPSPKASKAARGARKLKRKMLRDESDDELA